MGRGGSPPTRLEPPPWHPQEQGLVSRAPASGFRHKRLERSGNVPRALSGLGTGGTPWPFSSEQAIQGWCSPHHVTSDALRLFSLVTAFSEPSRKKMQNRSCTPSREEVLGTPAPSTPRPAHHGAIILVCAGRFMVKREGRKRSAHSPLRIWYSNLLLESGRGWPEGWGWEGRREVVLSEDELCMAWRKKKKKHFWTSEAAELRSKAWEVKFGGRERRSF